MPVPGTMTTNMYELGCMAYVPVGHDSEGMAIHARCGNPIEAGARTAIEFGDWDDHDATVLLCKNHIHLLPTKSDEVQTWLAEDVLFSDGR